MTGSSPSTRDLFTAAAVIAILSAACLAGLPETLGAHPWWAVKSGIIGSMIGGLAWLGLRFAQRSAGFILRLGTGCLVASTAAAVIGKRIFAASLAENALAGRFWYLGWFAVFASLAIVVIHIVQRRVSR